jgi:hypothetical protein
VACNHDRGHHHACNQQAIAANQLRHVVVIVIAGVRGARCLVLPGSMLLSNTWRHTPEQPARVCILLGEAYGVAGGMQVCIAGMYTIVA